MMTVYLVHDEGGFISEAYSTSKDVEVVILDKCTQDEEMLAEVNKEIARIKKSKKYKEIEIY